jgi:hypothetical protein
VSSGEVSDVCQPLLSPVRWSKRAVVRLVASRVWRRTLFNSSSSLPLTVRRTRADSAPSEPSLSTRSLFFISSRTRPAFSRHRQRRYFSHSRLRSALSLFGYRLRRQQLPQKRFCRFLEPSNYDHSTPPLEPYLSLRARSLM